MTVNDPLAPNVRPAAPGVDLVGSWLRHGRKWPLLAAVAICVAVLVGAISVPIEVPSTGSPPVFNSSGLVNGTESVGQTIVSARDGLNRVDVVLAVERPVVGGELVLHVMDGPSGQPIRSVRRDLASLPQGSVGQYRPNTVTEKWADFWFEAIPDSANRHLYLLMEGPGVPAENGAKVALTFHNRYPFGQAYLNREPTNAHVTFRTYSAGHPIDLLPIIAGNLVSKKPFPLSSPVTYLVVGACFVFLAGFVGVATCRLKGEE